MILLDSFYKNKYSFLTKLVKFRLILINFLIFLSLSFVLHKNLYKIRYTLVITDDGEAYELDRFTSKIKVKK